MPRNISKTADSGREPSLTVVIPTYRRPAVLHRLLGALEEQVTGKPNYAVVVVNDGSHDDAYAKVVERFQSMIDYVALPQNRGRGAARNAGVRKAKGRYLVFTDDDCVPPPHWLDWLAADLEEYPYVAAVGGPTRPLPSDSPGFMAQYATIAGLQPRPHFRHGQLHCLPTANLAVRRDWFGKVGGFDERFNGGEDTNLTYRLKRAGAPFHLDWSWFTHHDQEWSLGGLCERMFRYGHGNGQQKGLTGDANIADLAPPSSVWSILGNLPGKIRPIWGQYDGAGQPIYRRLIYAALDLMRHFFFQLGLMRGYKRAAQIGGENDPPPGE